MIWLVGITNAMNVNLAKFWEMVRDRGPAVPQSIGMQTLGHNWVTEQQQSATL